ncbi:uncharacterized protein LOC119336955 [Triticum dicoccoides]|uniref:uncharacterized protein LOC119336955 n=1 Tax=Triticum dicoccoides TaxID=85692 RepID=UPI0018911648|nr:uncharacterized protein LOC119336955 [Triticum dicoccoides]
MRLVGACVEATLSTPMEAKPALQWNFAGAAMEFAGRRRCCVGALPDDVGATLELCRGCNGASPNDVSASLELRRGCNGASPDVVSLSGLHWSYRRAVLCYSEALTGASSTTLKLVCCRGFAASNGHQHANPS